MSGTEIYTVVYLGIFQGFYTTETKASVKYKIYLGIYQGCFNTETKALVNYEVYLRIYEGFLMFIPLKKV